MPKPKKYERTSLMLPIGALDRIDALLGVDHAEVTRGQGIRADTLREWVMERLAAEERKAKRRTTA